MQRRDFLRVGTTAVGAAGLASLVTACRGERDRGAERALSLPGLLDRPAAESPVDTVVVVMLENRSFDHHLGWLGTDEVYLDAGRRAFGRDFGVAATQDQRFPAVHGGEQQTFHLPAAGGPAGGYRGCEYPVPGHGWENGRAQRDHGFLGRGSGNDEYAIGYYDAEDVAFYTTLAHRFVVADHHFASLLGPTFPNRQYLHAATSDGEKRDPTQMDAGIYRSRTIWDALRDADVSARYYYVDTPWLALWGERLFGQISPIDDYFDDAARGTLPHVVMVDPAFQGAERADDHPHGDIRTGQRFVRSVFSALARSPQWSRSVFVLTYDEWGGFFDHVRPPVVPDDRRSRIDRDNFGQTGFRVPTLLASPFARPGYVDHTQYDHTSILRFLEWRFLGAPAHGTSAPHGRWHLTKRDQHANTIGSSLVQEPTVEIGFDLTTPLAAPAGGCAHSGGAADTTEVGPGGVPHSAAFEELRGTTFPPATERPWLTA